MKKIIILFTLSLFIIGPVTAQTYDLSTVEKSFEEFADGVANALPAAASMGLNWNDAYVGKFPHMGLGLTLGAVMLPVDAFKEVYNMTGNTGIDDFSSIGIPLPVYTVDYRIGIPILPMDVGIKAGVLNSSMLSMDKFSLDYKMFGADVRWAFWEDKGLKGVRPDLSVGIGYTYLSGNITVPVETQTVQINQPGIDYLTIEDTDMFFKWGSSVFDLKAQISKKILILNLSAGAGVSYGISHAGGGITGSTVKVNGATTISQTEIDTINKLTGVNVDTDGVDVSSRVNGGSFRVFGGAGLNLWLLKIDLGLLYAMPSNTLGGSMNVRLQY